MRSNPTVAFTTLMQFVFASFVVSCSLQSADSVSSLGNDVAVAVRFCSVDIDCDDGNDCTDDTCLSDGTCHHAAVAGLECNDGNACTQADECNADGLCIGESVHCGDDNPCTADSCDPESGCSNVPLEDGKACNDFDFCTLGDACLEGVCTPGSVKECKDGNLTDCVAPACNPANGKCELTSALEAGTECTDGNACTADDTCDGAGNCKSGDPVDCDSDIPCWQSWCNESTKPGDDPCTGTWKEPGVLCNDGDVCTTDDLCVADGDEVICLGTSVACDDGNPCTIGTCNTDEGCIYEELDDGVECSLGDGPCFKPGTCDAGECVGAIAYCDDNNPCTDDLCDPDNPGECLHVNNEADCDDLDACTTSDSCNADGECLGSQVEGCLADAIPFAVELPAGTQLSPEELSLVVGSHNFPVEADGTADSYAPVDEQSFVAATKDGVPFLLGVTDGPQGELVIGAESSALAILYLALTPNNLSEETRQSLLEAWATLPEVSALAEAMADALKLGESPFTSDDPETQQAIGTALSDALLAAQQEASLVLSSYPGYMPPGGLGSGGDNTKTDENDGFKLEATATDGELSILVENTVARNGIVIVERLEPKPAAELAKKEIGPVQHDWFDGWGNANVGFGPFPLQYGQNVFHVVAIGPSWLKPVSLPPYADEYDWTVMVFFWNNGIKPGIESLVPTLDLNCAIEMGWNLFHTQVPAFLDDFPPSFWGAMSYLEELMFDLVDCMGGGGGGIWEALKMAKKVFSFASTVVDISCGLVTFLASLEPVSTFEITYCRAANCEVLDLECGEGDNLCDGVVDCGACPQGFSCDNGTCVQDCVPMSCQGIGVECGTGWNDGCGGTVNCGLCGSGSCQNGVCVNPCDGINCPVCQTCDDGGDCVADATQNGASCGSGKHCTAGECIACPSNFCQDQDFGTGNHCAGDQLVSCGTEGACNVVLGNEICTMGCLNGSCKGAVCGNSSCESGESCQSCPQDCCYCGNGSCDAAVGENSGNCADDCGAPCGDGTCKDGETCWTCPSDCGSCQPFHVEEFNDGGCPKAKICQFNDTISGQFISDGSSIEGSSGQLILTNDWDNPQSTGFISLGGLNASSSGLVMKVTGTFPAGAEYRAQVIFEFSDYLVVSQPTNELVMEVDFGEPMTYQSVLFRFDKFPKGMTAIVDKIELYYK